MGIRAGARDALRHCDHCQSSRRAVVRNRVSSEWARFDGFTKRLLVVDTASNVQPDRQCKKQVFYDACIG